jgi:hypothetical protein
MSCALAIVVFTNANLDKRSQLDASCGCVAAPAVHIAKMASNDGQDIFLRIIF